jgi:protease PrsW
MGFAQIENIMYVMDGGLGTAVLRAVLSVPGHGFFAVLMGYHFSLAKFHEGVERRNYILKAIFLPILFHGLYDFSIMYITNSERNAVLAIGLVVFFTFLVIRLWRIGIRKIKLHIKMDEELATAPQTINKNI